MRSKQMLMGAAVLSCLAATMAGAYAQETNTRDQFKAPTQQGATNARPSGSIRQGQGPNINAPLKTRANSDGTSTNGQLERRGLTNESRTGAAMREGGERRGTRGERTAYSRDSQERYVRARRGERRLYARTGVEGYRDRAVDAGVPIADYGYRTRRLYAYAPTYEPSYVATGAYYDYTPDSDVVINTGRYYTPGLNVAYARPYYDYAPGVSVGIGIGPVGIGLSPAWAW